jgi:hypothetical protein
MLNPLYTVFSSATVPQRNHFAGLFFAVFACVSLAFNAAGQLHLGFLGLIGIILLFLMLGTVGCYWYIVSIHFLGEWFSQTQYSTSSSSTSSSSISSSSMSPSSAATHQPWLTALQGLWPLILLGPAVSAQRWWPSLGAFITFGIIFGTGLTLIVAIRRAYDIHWIQASLCLFLTMILGSLALGGLIGWPIMFLLGAKDFSIAVPM